MLSGVDMIKLIKLTVLSLVVLFAVATEAKQYVPPPIDLGIQNIPQETQVWCWATVAQQVIMWKRGPANTPPQCAMVAIANNAPPQTCCNQTARYNGNPACHITGSTQQIQWLIANFGGSYSSLNPPANPMVLYNTLRSGRPIILQLQSTPFAGHVVVVRGMFFQGGVPYLIVNDPYGWGTLSQPVPFQNILHMWAAAIAVN